MRILSAEAMRAVDQAAIERLGIPSLVLMENAAIGVADAIGEVYGEAESATVFCGPGNNGGDGLAVARHLAARGYDVEIVLVAGKGALRGDAAVQLEICLRLDLPVREVASEEDLGAALAAAAGRDLVVDALFGTGLARPLSGLFAAAARGLSSLALPRVAVDLPSGFSGSAAEARGEHVVADLTVTFAALKVPHVFPPGAAAAGQVVVADLGFPAWLIEEALAGPNPTAPAAGGAAPREESADNRLHLLAGEELSGLLRPRAGDSHKGDFGHLLLVAGSTGKAGAAVLAARAAVRSGAGLVTAAVPEPVLPALAAGAIEAMSLPLPASASGQLAAAAVEQVLEAAGAAGRSALGLGPGLGQDPETVAAIRRIVLESSLPLVLDADGLNAFGGHPGLLAGRRAPTILTPHPGELGRLLGVATGEVQADRIAAARRAAAESGCIVVLKGSLSLVATPEGTVHANPTGNPGMASGGSGDVLTGLLSGLLAQRLEPLVATWLAVYLHGLAGDLGRRRLGGPVVPAGELVAELAGAFDQLSRAAGDPWHALSRASGRPAAPAEAPPRTQATGGPGLLG